MNLQCYRVVIELMNIAAFKRRYWPEAVRAAGYNCIELPAGPVNTHFESTLEARIQYGQELFNKLKKTPIDLIVDAHGDGMLFIDDPRKKGMDCLLHHALGVPLVSHWSESLRIYFKNIDIALLHEALQSPTWYKGIFTQGHLAEMEWMRIPGCFYLPLAANNFTYPSDSPAVDWDGPHVFFAGNQHSLYFAHSDGVDTRTQWPGGLALASVSDGSTNSFLESYRQYELGPEPRKEDTPQRRAECVQQYYKTKMFYSASRNLGTRDRFLIFLKKKFGDRILLAGHDRWRTIYGLDPVPFLDANDYVTKMRNTPFCLAVINGDNDDGLNLRHFQITAYGGFLLSYHVKDLELNFKIGQECESFRNEKELMEKIDYYIAHPDQRDRIAMAGQQRTLNHHLLSHRFESILDWLKSQGKL